MTTPGYSPSPFQIEERIDPDGGLRLVLTGELDLAVADELARRLGEVKERGQPVRLDLARLEFIDSTGLRELVAAIRDSRRNRWRLEIGTRVSDQVKRVIELTGLASEFWPPHSP